MLDQLTTKNNVCFWHHVLGLCLSSKVILVNYLEDIINTYKSDEILLWEGTKMQMTSKISWKWNQSLVFWGNESSINTKQAL